MLAPQLPGVAPCTVVWPRSSSSPNCTPGTWPWPPRHGDYETLESLDTAAEITGMRGAPANAAELLDMAIELGGD